MRKRLLSIMLTAALAITSAMPVLANEIAITTDDEAVVIGIEETTDDSIEIVGADDVEDAVTDEVAVEELEIVNEQAVASEVAEDIVISQVIDGYEVTVKAAAETIPEGSSIAIVKIANEDVNESVEDGTVIKKLTFDVEVTDVEGNVVEIDKNVFEVSVDSVIKDGTYAVMADYTVASEDGVNVEAEDGKSSYTIIIIQPNEQDKKAPVVESAKMFKDTYHRGDRIEMETVLKDDVSGIDYAAFYFRNTKTGEFEGVFFYPHFYDENDNWTWVTDDIYPTDRTQTVYENRSNGTYKIDHIVVVDNAGNSRYYDDTRDCSGADKAISEKLPKSLKNLKFKVVNSDSEFSPTLSKLTVSPVNMKIKAEDRKKLKFVAKASSKKGKIRAIKLCYRNKKKNPNTKKTEEYSYNVLLYPKSNGSKEFVPSEDEYMYGSEYYAGTWKLTKIVFYSEDNVEKELTKSKYLNQTIKVAVTGNNTSKSVAKVKDIKFDSGESVTLGYYGKDIPFTVKLSDAKKNDFIEVDVTLYNKKEKKYISASAMNYSYSEKDKKYVVNNKDVATGVFDLNKYEMLGDYTVSSVRVYLYNIYCDVEKTSYGDVRHLRYIQLGYRDYNVKDPITGKNTLTSQMKKVKMKIKKP